MIIKIDIATKLHSIKNGILGASNLPKIQEKLISLGYTPENITQRIILLNKAKYFAALHAGNYGDHRYSVLRTNWAGHGWNKYAVLKNKN